MVRDAEDCKGAEFMGNRRSDPSKADRDNHANQLNSNNDAYWSSRGMSRPSTTNEPYGDTPSPEPDGQQPVPGANTKG